MNPSTTASTTITPNDEYYWSSIFFIFIVPALGGMLFGYDIGSTSFAVVSSTYLDIDTTWSPTLTGLFVAAPSAGALIGSCIVFFIAERIGRLTELRIGSMFYIVGAILESITSSSLAIIFMGRVLYGLGIGFSMHGAPTYLGEMLPSQIRGALVSLKEVFIVLGILLGYTTGYIFTDTHFVYSYLSSLVASTIMLLLSFQIPKSTRWLLSQGRKEEMFKSLKYIYYDPDAQFEALVNAYEEQQQQQLTIANAGEGERDDTVKDGIFHPRRRNALIAGIGLVVLQQVTGQPSVLSYATPIFQKAGLAASSSLVVAVFKLVATSTAVLTVEKYGRKQLLYVGCSLMLLALLVLTLTFGETDDDDDHADGGNVNESTGDDTTTSSGENDIRNTTILIAMFVYIGGYQIGFGPMSWLIMSEVFPQSVRGQAVAVAVQVNFLLNALVQFIVPVLESWWGLGKTFGLFGVLTVYSLYFVYRYVLETKGLTLEEIEHLFSSTEQGRTETSDDEEQQHLLLTEIQA